MRAAESLGIGRDDDSAARPGKPDDVEDIGARRQFAAEQRRADMAAALLIGIDQAGRRAPRPNGDAPSAPPATPVGSMMAP